MRHYPAYKMDDALDEYAIRVYTLVEHALRADAQRLSENILAARAANATSSEISRLNRKLNEATSDPIENYNDKEDYSGLSDLKGML